MKLQKTNLATFLILLFGMFTLFTACESDDEGDGGNGTTNTGKYAGILVGSSGWFVINFEEDNASASVHFDGNDYQLSTSTPIIDGNAYNDILFTDGTISMSFSIDAMGLQPAASFSIPGHDVVATIGNAEQNTIELYEGTSHSETINGENTYFVDYIYNLSLNYGNNTYTIIEKVTDTNGSNPIGETNVYEGSFTITGNTITFNLNNVEGAISGTITGDTITHNDENFSFEFVKVYNSEDDVASPIQPVSTQWSGTFQGDDNGTFTCTIWYYQNNPVDLEGTGYSNFLEEGFNLYPTSGMSNNNLKFISSHNHHFTGSINGNNMSGTWQIGDGEYTGSFTASKQ